MTAVTVTQLNNAGLDADHLATIATSAALTATDRLGRTKRTLEGALNAISAITDRGAWTTATAYLVKDVVTESGTWYICISAHTSGATFAGDESARWRVFQGVTAADLALATAAAELGVGQGGVLQDYMTNVFSPDAEGALGDGVNDDTYGIYAAAVKLQAAGGGILRFTPGKTYKIFFNGVTYGFEPIVLTSLTGVLIDWTGATIVMDTARSWAATTGNFIKCDTCNDVEIRGGAFEGVTVPFDGTVESVVVAQFVGDCNGIRMPYLKASGVLAGLLMGTPTSLGCRNVEVGTAIISDSIYGINGQNSGSNLVVHNLVTDNVGRSFFSYGASHIKVNCRSKNPRLNADVSISGVSSSYNYMTDVEINYFNTESSAAGLARGHCVLLQHATSDTVNSTFTNIRVNLDVTYNGVESGLWSAFHYSKLTAAGAADSSTRAHELHGLRVSGVIRGVSTTTGTYAGDGMPVHLGNASSVWGGSEIITEVDLSNIEILGSTNALSIDVKRILPALQGSLYLDKIKTPTTIDVWGGGLVTVYAPSHADARIRVGDISCLNSDSFSTTMGVRELAANSSPVTVQPVYSGLVITNFSAGGTVVYNLPAATPGLEFAFARIQTQAMQITVNGSDEFSTGGSNNILQLDSDGAYVNIKCRSAGRWDIQSIAGTTSYLA